ncbi:PTS system, lactose/cellobiose family IIC component [Klebsiella pneumoniae]|uniref:PTS system, lactose/cellobiose family IIC component n=1 Tax=Klebsiella pneumoniae TaxID=573 RepID=A0A377TLY4_KLEPN|nr:PTS system, lactose/cellobiose family IIC component [Klebsiella pneumoniae]
MIKNSFDLLIPVLVVVLTLYPLSLFIQHHFDMLIPQAIMAIFSRWFRQPTLCRQFCWRC